MADHIHGRITRKLTMIVGDINMKIWFLILVAVVLSGCESPQVARQSEMAEARQMVRAQFGGQLTPQQEAYLSMQVFQQLEAQRQARAIAAGQIIARGFSDAGDTMERTSARLYQQQPFYSQPAQNIQAMQLENQRAGMALTPPLQVHVPSAY